MVKAKALWKGYHIFLREQLGKMKEQDWENYCNIKSKKWKKIKEDPARLIAYNNRTKQMRDEAEKPKLHDHGEACGKNIQRQLKKYQKLKGLLAQT